MDIQKTLQKWIKILKLQDYNIQVIEANNLDCDGSNFLAYNMNSYRIIIKQELSDEEKEKTLIHELLHIITKDENQIATDNLEGYTIEIYNRFYERSTEKFSQILYKLEKENE